jgi:hypothetical protein
MKACAELSQRLTVRAPSERVAWGHCPCGSALPFAPLLRAACVTARVQDHRDARSAPEASSVWAGIALRIPIAEKAGVVMPSN